MGESFSFPPVEKKVEQTQPTEPSPAERLVAERWERLNEGLRSFEEREAEEAFNPERFMSETTEAWERRHGSPEHTVDTMSPFDRANWLLAILVEQGAEWSAPKRAAVRRATVGFIQQSVGAMTPTQQDIFRNTVLSDKKALEEVGQPKEGEQKLVTQWMQDTVGRGVRR